MIRRRWVALTSVRWKVSSGCGVSTVMSPFSYHLDSLSKVDRRWGGTHRCGSLRGGGCLLGGGQAQPVDGVAWGGSAARRRSSKVSEISVSESI